MSIYKEQAMRASSGKALMMRKRKLLNFSKESEMGNELIEVLVLFLCIFSMLGIGMLVLIVATYLFCQSSREEIRRDWNGNH